MCSVTGNTESVDDHNFTVGANLIHHAAPADETDLAKYFTRANKERIAELLETLGSLGKARELSDGRYVGV